MFDSPLVDDELLVYTLLKRELPEGATLAAELDVDSIDTLPFITYNVRGGDQSGNGPGLWSSPLTIRVFAEGQDAGWELCRDLYRVIHLWAEPGNSTVPGVAYVTNVTDLSKFSRDATVAMEGKQITQYTGSFELITRTI